MDEGFADRLHLKASNRERVSASPLLSFLAASPPPRLPLVAVGIQCGQLGLEGYHLREKAYLHRGGYGTAIALFDMVTKQSQKSSRQEP